MTTRADEIEESARDLLDALEGFERCPLCHSDIDDGGHYDGAPCFVLSRALTRSAEECDEGRRGRA